MDFKRIFTDKLVLLDCVSGSTAYGLNLPTSDVDRRGVFHLSKVDFYAGVQTEQLQGESGDEAYSELGRFIHLLSKANPTMIELLHTDKEYVNYKNPLLNCIQKEWYLTKECKNTFAGYALTQIKKARGLNKKIVNPMEKERKTVLDFCFVPFGQGAINLNDFLANKGLQQEDCGLSKIPHMQDSYGLYHGVKGYKGVFSGENANDVVLSSVMKDARPITLMSFNKAGYSSYCKKYKEYWDWVESRNESRYEATMAHGKNYDAKNMMHTFRLLTMAKEIAQKGEVNVFRKDNTFLLAIRAGQYEYDDLVTMAEERVDELRGLYDASTLPDSCDSKRLKEVLVEIREALYK